MSVLFEYAINFYMLIAWTVLCAYCASKLYNKNQLPTSISIPDIIERTQKKISLKIPVRFYPGKIYFQKPYHIRFHIHFDSGWKPIYMYSVA